jgi:hypothetical protein
VENKLCRGERRAAFVHICFEKQQINKADDIQKAYIAVGGAIKHIFSLGIENHMEYFSKVIYGDMPPANFK